MKGIQVCSGVSLLVKAIDSLLDALGSLWPALCAQNPIKHFAIKPWCLDGLAFEPLSPHGQQYLRALHPWWSPNFHHPSAPQGLAISGLLVWESKSPASSPQGKMHSWGVISSPDFSLDQAGAGTLQGITPSLNFSFSGFFFPFTDLYLLRTLPFQISYFTRKL